MANSFVKPTRVVDASIALLKRQILLPGMFWRQSFEDFRGALGDTVTLRLPAYAVAETRALRSPGPITLTELHERAIDISLNTDVYSAVAVTDEELTLDISDFSASVLMPQVESVARGVEDLAVALMVGATYQTTVTMDPANPRAALLSAKAALDLANIPASERFVAMGSNVEAALLSDGTLTQVNTSGSDSVLRDAVIGRLYGFTLISVPALPADSAFAFHRTAYAMSTAAPIVPAGVPFGSTVSSDGLAIRWIRDYDAMNLRDRSILNCYTGFAAVTDQGTINDEGRFVPSPVPDPDGADAMMVRSVHITLGDESP